MQAALVCVSYIIYVNWFDYVSPIFSTKKCGAIEIANSNIILENEEEGRERRGEISVFLDLQNVYTHKPESKALDLTDP